jgi:hypothetical protein
MVAISAVLRRFATLLEQWIPATSAGMTGLLVYFPDCQQLKADQVDLKQKTEPTP